MRALRLSVAAFRLHQPLTSDSSERIDSTGAEGDYAPRLSLGEQPIAIHAHRLLLWVEDRAGQEILAREMAAIYREMCCELLWCELRWEGRGGVAQHVRALGGHPKVYRWFVYPDGSRHRLHVYPIARVEPALVSARHRRDRVTNQTPLVRLRTSSAAAA